MRRTLAALGIVLTVVGAASAGDVVSITLPAETARLAPGPGVEIAQNRCMMCHSVDYITMQPRGNAAQWQGVVAKMRTVFGAPISDEDAKVIAEYLTATYGPAK